MLIDSHPLPSTYLPNPGYIGHDEWVTLVGIVEGKAVGQREGGVYAHMSMFALLGGGGRVS